MAFDMKKTLDDMLGAIAGVLTGEWPKIKSCVEKALQDEKAALQEIADARLRGEITDDEMRSELDDEALALKAALLSCQVQAKAMVQEAANAAIAVLTDAIKTALPGKV